jgi:hypothetical protein
MYLRGVDTLFVQNKCFTVKMNYRFLHNKAYQLPIHVNKNAPDNRGIFIYMN